MGSFDSRQCRFNGLQRGELLRGAGGKLELDLSSFFFFLREMR